jgi:hypothetical protein
MEKKINLEKIWLNSGDKFENVDGSTYWNIGKDAMLEAIKQALELAAENARISSAWNDEKDCWEKHKIDKESILNTNNQII